MAISEREKLLRIYAPAIDQMARIRANGWTAELMDRAGYHDEAALFRFQWLELDLAELIPIVEQRTVEIRQERETSEARESRAEPTLQQPTIPPPYLQQTNFFDIVPKTYPDYTIVTDEVLESMRSGDPEAGIGKLHNSYQRAKLHQAEAARQRNAWIRFLRSIGAILTWREKRKKLGEEAMRRIRFLQALGIWQEIKEQHGLTSEIISKLRGLLSADLTFYTDPTSSDGFTLYHGPEALALKQALDQLDE